MGTNYYLTTKNRDIAHKYFAEDHGYGVWNEEYKLRDTPDFHYRVHLNKLSYGWKPIFQNHKVFKSFKELRNFYKSHESELSIFDEYGRSYTWDEYEKDIFDHMNREPEPLKWVYKEDPILGKPGKKYLMTEECEPEEAELWIPIDHIDYFRTQNEAIDLLGVDDAYQWEYPNDYHRDPDYKIDWMEGEFS